MTVVTIQTKDIQTSSGRIGQYYDVAILDWIQTFDGNVFRFSGAYTTKAIHLREDEYLLHDRLIYQYIGRTESTKKVMQMLAGTESEIDRLKTLLLTVTCVAIRQLAETHPDLVLARFAPEEQQHILQATLLVETLDEVDIYREILNIVCSPQTLALKVEND